MMGTVRKLLPVDSRLLLVLWKRTWLFDPTLSVGQLGEERPKVTIGGMTFKENKSASGPEKASL